MSIGVHQYLEFLNQPEIKNSNKDIEFIGKYIGWYLKRNESDFLTNQIAEQTEFLYSRMKISPECRVFATLGYDRIVHIRKFDTFELIFRLDQTSEKGDFAFSFDSMQMAFNDEKSISVWNLLELREVNHIKGKYSCIKFSKQNYLLAMVGKLDFCLEVYFGSTKLFDEPLKISEREINSIDFSYDTTMLCAGGLDGRITIWDIADKKPPTTPKFEILVEGCQITKLIFSSKETYIIAGTQDAKLLLWDKVSGSDPTILTGHKSPVMHLLCSPDESRFISISSTSNMLLWKFENLKLSHDLVHKSAITSISVLDEKRFVTSGVDNSFLTWDFETCQILDAPEIAYGEDEGSGEQMNSRYVTNQDGSIIAKYHPNPRNLITYWNTENGDLIQKGSLSSNLEVSVMCFSLDGKWIALASHENVVVYSVEDPEKQIFGPWRAGKTEKDNETLLVRSLNKVLAKKLTKSMSTSEKEKHNVKSLSFLSNNVLCAGDDCGHLTVWRDVGTPNPQAKTAKVHNSPVNALAQSPNENLIATGSDYGSVRIWNLETITTDMNTLERHKDPIKCLIFLDQGKLITGCAKGTIILWKLKDLELSFCFPNNPKHVMIPSFFNVAGAGEYLIVGYETGEIIVWNFGGVAGRPEVSYMYETYDNRVLMAQIKEVVKNHTKVLKSVSVSHMKKIVLWSLNSVRTYQIKNAKEVTSDGKFIFSILQPNFLSSGSLSPIKKKKTKKAAIPQRSSVLKQKWKIRISDGETGKPVTGKPVDADLSGHNEEIMFMKCSNDNATLLTGDSSGAIYLWDIERRKVSKGPLQTIASANVGKFSTDGLKFAIGEGDGSLSVWDTRIGQLKARNKEHDLEIVCIDYIDRSETNSLWVTGGKDLKVVVWDAILNIGVFTLTDVFEDSIINVTLWDKSLFVAGTDYTGQDIKSWSLENENWAENSKEIKQKTLLNAYNMCPIRGYDKILTYYHDSKNLYYLMILDKDMIQNDQTIIVESPISKEEGEAPLHNIWVNGSDLICLFDNRVMVFKNLFRNEELFLKKMLEVCEFSRSPTHPKFASKLAAICSGQIGVVFPFMYNLLQAIAYTDDTSDDSNLLDTIFDLLEKQKKIINLDVFFEQDIHDRNIFDIIFAKKNSELLKTLIQYIIESYPVIETKEQAQMLSYFSAKKLNEMFHIFENDPSIMGDLLNYLFNRPVNFPKNYVYPALEHPFFTELPEYQITSLKLDEIMKHHAKKIENVKKKEMGNEIVQARCLYVHELLDTYNEETRKFWIKVSNFESSDEMFGNFTLIKLLEYKWLHNKYEKNGKQIFFQEAFYFLMFIFFFVANSSYILRYKIEQLLKGYHLEDSVYIQTALVLDVGLLCFLIHHVYGELKQALPSPKEYFESLWNYFDVLLVFLSFPAIIVDMLHCCEIVGSTQELQVFNSMTIFFGFLRLISYARGIDGSAFMVRLIIQVIIDMKNFLLFMFIFILGLGYSAYVLEVDFDYSHFESFNTFFTEMLGDTTDLWDMNPASFYVLYAFFLIASIILTITLLNLLISIISQTFGNVRDNEKFTRIFERWNIQTEIDSTLERDENRRNEPRYLIYLYNENHEEQENGKNDQTKSNLEKNQKTISRLMENLEKFSEELDETLKDNSLWFRDNFKKFTEDEMIKKKYQH